MTFDRAVALLFTLAALAAWGVVAMWNVWGLWPLSWGWWAANVAVTWLMGVVIGRLTNPPKP